MSITRGFARISFSRIGLFALLLLFFVPISGSVFNLSSAQAAFVWSPDHSSGNRFDCSNGQSDNRLFGDPIFTENIFSFTPENFHDESSDGKNALTSDSLQFDISPKNKLSRHISVKKGDLHAGQ